MDLPFGQTFAWADLAVIGMLIILEGVLSIDNALVLGLLAKRLPKAQQGRALTYGLVGAFVFRFVAVATITILMQYPVVKLVGGLYLLYVTIKYFLTEFRQGDEEGQSGDAANDESRRTYARFWPTVAVIELTDIAFAVDSILAAMALVEIDPNQEGINPKLWVVVSGGLLGVVMMRFAAVVFIKLLEKFPRFEVSAYLLVAVVGTKLFVEWGSHYVPAWHSYLNFHSPSSIAFWAFWLLMLAMLGLGFTGSAKQGGSAAKRDAES